MDKLVILAEQVKRIEASVNAVERAMAQVRSELGPTADEVRRLVESERGARSDVDAGTEFGGRRDDTMRFRVNAAERERIEANAKAAGFRDVSDFIRARCTAETQIELGDGKA